MQDKPIGSWFPLEQLKEWPDNPRIIDTNTIEAVARSIDEFGFASPIVARRENHQIICGHTRFRAAKLLKLDFVPTRFLDLNQEEANRLALADNKLGELATWDEDMLTDLLKELEVNQALDLGWSVDELHELLSELEPDQPRSEDNEIHDLDHIPDNVDPITKPGDIVTMGNHTLYCKDNIEVLRSMEENSIDSIVTDPPYGIDFMSKTTGWDKNVPGGEWAKECLRVLKPGGHIISFAATRTFHKLVTNLENAGFEVRDTINWLYFSGFPKSLDLSKAIDKHFGVEREIVGYGDGGLHRGSGTTVAFGVGNSKEQSPITKPATKEAKEADGWGTALKPAFEPATLCRKPLSEKTVALNWLKWRTGGLAIDKCRFGYGDPCWVGPNDEVGPRSIGGYQDQYIGGKIKNPISTNDPGARWPANIYQCPKASRGEREEGCDDLESKAVPGKKENKYMGVDSAGSRSSEVFNIHPTVKPIKLMRWLIRLVTPPGGTVLDTFLGSGTTMIAAELEGLKSIGIEREAKYCDIIRARVENAIDKGET